MAEVEAPFKLGIPTMRDILPINDQCEESSSGQGEDQVNDEAPNHQFDRLDFEQNTLSFCGGRFVAQS